MKNNTLDLMNEERSSPFVYYDRDGWKLQLGIRRMMLKVPGNTVVLHYKRAIPYSTDKSDDKMMQLMDDDLYKASWSATLNIDKIPELLKDRILKIDDYVKLHGIPKLVSSPTYDDIKSVLDFERCVKGIVSYAKCPKCGILSKEDDMLILKKRRRNDEESE